MPPKQPNRTEMKVPSIFKFISLASALLACVSPLAATEATRPAQPNFLLMLADDLGWQDVKVYDTVPLCCLNNLKWIVAQIMVG